MPTSELSDALNPHIVQTRQRRSSTSSYAVPHLQPVVQPPQVYVPHRSELELAISEPPPPPPPPPRTRTQPSPEGVHAVQELLRALSATREAQETERKRRIAWEQDQEVKYEQKQAEMERQLFEMRQVLDSFRNVIAGNFSTPSYSHAPPQCDVPMLSHHQQQMSCLPISPVSQPASHHDRPFFEGSSSQMLVIHHSYHENHPYQELQAEHADTMVVEPPSPAPSPSPIPTSDDPSSSYVRSALTRRKTTTQGPTSDDGDSSDGESHDEPSERPTKRINHHDTRCLSIHQAMRLHILRLMQIESGRHLPDDHVEGVPLGPHEPIRFVWNKTPKQSPHNSRMKTRILADLKLNRRLYKHVPDKDFSKKSLESVFDQSFVTFRQKFKAQRDASVALTLKKREDSKALKARRLSRKKAKLSSRSETRTRLEVFAHAIFDGALQVDCMSSEESDGGDSQAESTSSVGMLRIRGLPWRSSRLQRFYGRLDEEERLERIQKPKRGIGKKERCRGPDKEGFCMPPKGVATWMISKRWINFSKRTHPDLPVVLKTMAVDKPDFDGSQLGALGEDSDDESPFENSLLQYPSTPEASSLVPVS